MKDYIDRVLEAVAKANGVSAQEVEREIEVAIATAIQNTKAENNQGKLKVWSSMTQNGQFSSVAEAVVYLCSLSKELQDSH